MESITKRAAYWREAFAKVNADCLFGVWVGGHWLPPSPEEFTSFVANADTIDYYANQIQELSGMEEKQAIRIAIIMIMGQTYSKTV